MRSRFAKLFRWWPIGTLLFLEAILFAANYKPGTFLMGWDNVMPEFNFKQALLTNLFGVWQEHRGLGLYDGMGHAANLVHTIFLWILSLALPTNLLRYSFHFLMHVLGGIGAYILLKKFVNNKTVALAGAMFYLFNLATIQMFYTPLEAFSVHFAALPWLAWGLLGYLTQPSRKTFFLFLLISLLSTPQFFIPTLLLPIGILLVALSIPYIVKKPFSVFLLPFTFLLINAFWLLPYVYGLPHNAPVIQSAKINQMSSNEVFARNQAFGGLNDVLRLRGFSLDFEDMNAHGTTTFLMAPWREFLTLPFVNLGSWLLVAITILGIGMNGFLVPFIASLVFMANDTVIIKEITEALRQGVPILKEAYRFPFTKFSLLFAFSSSVFFTIGLAQIAKIRIVTIIVIGLIVILALPAFRGNFISDGLRVPLPDDYPRVFEFMKNKPLGRIAYLPQQQYWSWKYYRWGYRGSGFVWYGLSQPIMDRAFDPWSGYNENYYWEISRSIYSKDAAELSSVLNKYDIRYILMDEHIVSPSSDRGLFTPETKELLAQMQNINEIARFGKLTVYERLGGDSQSFVSLKTNLPTVSPSYRWTDNDVAFGELGDYIAVPTTNYILPTTNYAYPFRSLFTKRSVDEREFDIVENEDNLLLLSRALPGFPVFFEKGDVKKQENNKEQCVADADVYVDVEPIIDVHSDNSSSITAPTNDTIPKPRLYVKIKKTCDDSRAKIVGKTMSDPIQPADKFVSNPENTRSQDFLNRFDITTSVTEDKTVVNVTIPKADAIVYDSTKSADLIAENVKPCGVLRDGTATAENINQSLRFTNRNQRGCLSFGVGNLPHRDGYLVAVESRHISGRPLLFSLINQTAKHVELETYLPTTNYQLPPTSYFVLPPLASDGLGYTVYLSNDAIGTQETVNDIKSTKFYRIPYQELITLRSAGVQPLSAGTQPQGPPLSVDHPNPAYYLAKLDPAPQGNLQPTTLILSQSFHPGWKAYEVNCKRKTVNCKIAEALPFLFGTELKDHVLVNNWSNGWRLEKRGISTNYPINQLSNKPIEDNRTIVIFFLPQLLQWIGFLLLPIPFLFTLFRRNWNVDRGRETYQTKRHDLPHHTPHP